MPADNVFDRAVEEIAEGRRVDWNLLDSQATDDEERERLQWLRIIEQVGELHRSTMDPLDAPGGLAGPAAPEGDKTTHPEQTRGSPQRGWGRYQLLQKVGEGSFGSVYRAWDPQLERELAIKILHGDFANDQLTERLLREGRALAQIRHANVVSVHAVESHESRVGLCMEFIRGQTLDDVLRTQGTFGPREATLVGEDLCRALLAVHRAGFVHRDVKARNVMREDAGRIVLMDFGTGQEMRLIEALRGRGIAGTPLYMAPEVLSGEPASPSSDVYSVGVLLFHLLTADFPVRGDNLDDLRQAHRLQRRTRLSELRPDAPLSFVRAVERAVACSPQERYQSAAALLEALGGPAEVMPSPHPFLKRLTTAAIIGLIAVGTALALGGLESLAFHTTFDSADFAHEGALDWLRWGLKSTVAPVVLLLLAWLIVSFAIVVRTVVLRLSRRARALDESAQQWFRANARRLSLDNASVLASWLLLVAGSALLLAWWWFFPLFDAYTTRITDGAAETLSRLSPAFQDEQDQYRQTFSSLLLFTGLLWYAVMKFATRTHQTLGFGHKTGAIAVIALSLISLDLPYRVLLHNKAEVATWDGRECYILGERTDDVLLFCPGLRVPRRRVVSKHDSNLTRLGRFESVYTKFSPPPTKDGI